MTALAEHGSLRFDREAGAWWSLDNIRARSPTSNVIDLIGYRLARLPAKAQDALASLAFLGASANVPRGAIFQFTVPVHSDIAW